MEVKKLVFKVFTFLLLVLFISSVNAQEDFSASTTPEVSLCPCSDQAYTVTIYNTGAVPSSYSLIAAGDTKDWMSFNPKNFALNPGEGGTFNVGINSVCNIAGDFDAEIIIQTSNGLAKAIKQTLTISECYDYSLELGKEVQEAEDAVEYMEHGKKYDLCTNAQYSIPILITNNEDFENEYSLYSNAPEWASFALNKVKLKGKQSGILLLDADTTGILGQYDVKLNSVSALGDVKRKNGFDVSVGNCYDLSIDVLKTQETACAEEKSTIDVLLENKGTLNQKIDLGVEGPRWAYFEEPSITLDPESEQATSLSFVPGAEDVGNHNVKTFSVPDNKSEFKVFDSVSVEVIEKEACYQASISTKAAITNKYKEDFVFVKVTNNGIKEATYQATVEGPSWVSISPSTLTLNPGKTGNLNLKINPNSEDEPGSFTANIALESNDLEYTENVLINLKHETAFEKSVKETISYYKYYFYLLIALLVIILAFINRIISFFKKTKKKIRDYKIRRNRIRNLRIARENKKKENKKIRKQKKESLGTRTKVVIFVILAALSILIGHFMKLYNLKYLHVYVWNFVVGYLYYILVVMGILFLIAIALYLYNRQKNKKTRSKKFKFSITLRVLLIALIVFASYFGWFNFLLDAIVLYSYYIVLGIVLLVVIIVAISLYKALSKHLK